MVIVLDPRQTSGATVEVTLGQELLSNTDLSRASALPPESDHRK
jgi:hypothetical protein